MRVLMCVCAEYFKIICANVVLVYVCAWYYKIICANNVCVIFAQIV